MHQPPSLGGSQGEPVYGLTLKKQSFNCHYFITVKGFPSKCKPNLYELCSSMYFTQALKPTQICLPFGMEHIPIYQTMLGFAWP